MSKIMPQMRAGEPLRYQAVSVVPLFIEQSDSVFYRLAAEAIADKSLVVEEVSEAGAVPELLVRNGGRDPVLFIEGEELIGSKQNRIVNTTILVAAGSTVRIPVSCVEQGRWRYCSRAFDSSGSHSPASLRHTLKKSLARSARLGRGHESDQQAVWRQVRNYLGAHGVSSRSSDMSELFTAQQAKVSEYQANLAYVPGSSGLIVAIGQGTLMLDVFGSPATCEKMWPRLLSGCVLDALGREGDCHRVATRQIENLLAMLGDAKWKDVQRVGTDQEYRAEFHDHIASVLCLGETLLHASVVTVAGAG